MPRYIKCTLARGKLTEEAANTSSSCAAGAARQKPGHVGVTHFRDWLLCCTECKPSPTDSQISVEPGMKVGDGATTRQINSAQPLLSSYLSQCEVELGR